MTGGELLGFLIFIALILVLMNSGGGKQRRWEYTDPSGKQRFTPWYPSDHKIKWRGKNHFVIVDRHGREVW